jgi:hypothetical protein
MIKKRTGTLFFAYRYAARNELTGGSFALNKNPVMSQNTITHSISLQAAMDMTNFYRSTRLSDFPICETFEKASVLALLSNSNCAYLRIYYGRKATGEVDAILVAVNRDQEDILPAEKDDTLPGTEENLILEDGFRCPQFCPPPSPLNT